MFLTSSEKLHKAGLHYDLINEL